MPTGGVLTRMTIVMSNYGSGTAFSIDVDNREYWITAKHLLNGAKHPPYGTITSKSASLSVLDPRAESARWLPVKFSVLDVGKDIDVVVLAASTPLLQNPVPSPKAEFGSVMLGSDCEFLGFPSATGGAWKARFGEQTYWMPYVKHCFVSAVPAASNVVILDGVNNPGFSGGPVVYHTGPDQQIVAVISGMVTEPAEVISSLAKKPTPPAPHKAKVDENSGFIIAYSIDPAIEAIKKNPVGPLRHGGSPH
jgi:hypothetical protein